MWLFYNLQGDDTPSIRRSNKSHKKTLKASKAFKFHKRIKLIFMQIKSPVNNYLQVKKKST
ncbi:hypothetical protein D8Z77_01150 [Brevibacillus laterosporus]|nr:hypothetical protein D8Z77_01150 [Brevibacillus laterosporus]